MMGDANLKTRLQRFDISRAAKFTKNKNDQWNHADGFATTISTSLSLKL